MDAALRTLVRNRAGNRCEYCGLHQDDEPLYRFHIEHILPRQHGGIDDPNNLALACYHCNVNKGPNLAAIDPETGQMVRLFNPRQDRREEHFTVAGAAIAGPLPVLVASCPSGSAKVQWPFNPARRERATELFR